MRKQNKFYSSIQHPPLFPSSLSPLPYLGQTRNENKQQAHNTLANSLSSTARTEKNSTIFSSTFFWFCCHGKISGKVFREMLWRQCLVLLKTGSRRTCCQIKLQNKSETAGTTARERERESGKGAERASTIVESEEKTVNYGYDRRAISIIYDAAGEGRRNHFDISLAIFPAREKLCPLQQWKT